MHIPIGWETDRGTIPEGSTWRKVPIPYVPHIHTVLPCRLLRRTNLVDPRARYFLVPIQSILVAQVRHLASRGPAVRTGVPGERSLHRRHAQGARRHSLQTTGRVPLLRLLERGAAAAKCRDGGHRPHSGALEAGQVRAAVEVVSEGLPVHFNSHACRLFVCHSLVSDSSSIK